MKLDFNSILSFLNTAVGAKMVKYLLGNIYAWFESLEDTYLEANQGKNEKVKFIVYQSQAQEGETSDTMLADVLGYQFSKDSWNWEYVETQNLNEMLALHMQAPIEEEPAKKGGGMMDMGKDMLLKLLPKETMDSKVLLSLMNNALTHQKEKGNFAQVKLVLTPMSYVPKGKKKPRKVIMGQLVGYPASPEEKMQVIAEAELTRFIQDIIRHASSLDQNAIAEASEELTNLKNAA